MSQFAISGYDACAHMSEVGASAQRCIVQGLVHVHDWTHLSFSMKMHGTRLRGSSTVLDHLCTHRQHINPDQRRLAALMLHVLLKYKLAPLPEAPSPQKFLLPLG